MTKPRFWYLMMIPSYMHLRLMQRARHLYKYFVYTTVMRLTFLLVRSFETCIVGTCWRIRSNASREITRDAPRSLRARPVSACTVQHGILCWYISAAIATGNCPSVVTPLKKAVPDRLLLAITQRRCIGF